VAGEHYSGELRLWVSNTVGEAREVHELEARKNEIGGGGTPQNIFIEEVEKLGRLLWELNPVGRKQGIRQ
jgi:hypothetical protein